METFVLIAAAALVIALGMFLIHRLNAEHAARIEAHHFSDPFPAISRPPGYSRNGPTGQTPGRRRTGTWP
ncbi:hypothetical protein ACFV9D_10330 [Streptomyces sp. NPDC059875]|uniref:hypothetical protein n=1 Tax=unclassified Streptomyces TaxID=2593676 RepID=UPI003646319E